MSAVRSVWRLFVVTLTLAIYFSLAPFGYAVFWVWSRLPTRAPLARARRVQGIVSRAFRLFHDFVRWCGLVDYDPRQNVGSPPQRPCVLVANHPSWVDTTALLGSVEGVVTTVKPSIFRRWWLHPLLSASRHFEGGTGVDAVEPMIATALERLAEGFHVLVFPEGTRSPIGGLHPFGRTAFEIARRADVPLVPVLIECRPVWLSKEAPIYPPPPQPPTMRVTFLPPIEARESSSRTLRDMVRSDLSARLGLEAPGRAPVEGTTDDGIARDAHQARDRGLADVGGREARGHQG